MEIQWEEIDQKSMGFTERARIFGGWLVRTFTAEEGGGMAMIFVSDPNHEWGKNIMDGVCIE